MGASTESDTDDLESYFGQLSKFGRLIRTRRISENIANRKYLPVSYDELGLRHKIYLLAILNDQDSRSVKEQELEYFESVINSDPPMNAIIRELHRNDILVLESDSTLSAFGIHRPYELIDPVSATWSVNSTVGDPSTIRSTLLRDLKREWPEDEEKDMWHLVLDIGTQLTKRHLENRAHDQYFDFEDSEAFQPLLTRLLLNYSVNDICLYIDHCIAKAKLSMDMSVVYELIEQLSQSKRLVLDDVSSPYTKLPIPTNQLSNTFYVDILQLSDSAHLTLLKRTWNEHIQKKFPANSKITQLVTKNSIHGAADEVF